MAKSTGLMAFLVGAAAGATAVFLSDEKNRKIARLQLEKSLKSVRELADEVVEDPEAFARKQTEQALDNVEKSVAEAKKSIKKSTKKKKPAKK